MHPARLVPALLCMAAPLFSATFGIVVAGGASYSDIVLDDARSRLYLVNSNLNRLEIYNLRTRVFLTPITTDTQPAAAAMSRDGRFLYLTAYTAAVLDVIDLTPSQPAIVSRISLPSNPEGVAVGGDGRVLITTIASMIIHDPARAVGSTLLSVPVTPPAPTPPVLP